MRNLLKAEWKEERGRVAVMQSGCELQMTGGRILSFEGVKFHLIDGMLMTR